MAKATTVLVERVELTLNLDMKEAHALWAMMQNGVQGEDLFSQNVRRSIFEALTHAVIK